MPRNKTDLRIHDEISYLSNKISEIEQQLREEKKVHAKLQHQLDSKVLQLNSINDEIKVESTNFAEISQKYSQETISIENSYLQRMKELNQKKSKIQWEISAFDTVENENNFLHKQLELLSIDFHNDSLTRFAEMESYKQRAFDARMTMELVLRKELQALDLNFKQRAITNIEEEASLAATENQELFTELSRRQIVASDLITNQQATYDSLQRVEIEHEVMLTAADTYEKQITHVSELVEKAERKKNRLERKLENIQYEVNYNSRELFKRYDKGKELLDLYEKWYKTEIKKDKLKQKTLQLAQQVVLKSMKEAEDNHKKCSLKLSTMKFDDNMEDVSLEQEEKWMMQLDAEDELQDDNNFHQSQSTTVAHKGMKLPPDRHEAVEEDEYNAAWMITQMKYPTITGEMRKRLLTNEDKGKKKKGGGDYSLLPHQISISMTQHH